METPQNGCVAGHLDPRPLAPAAYPVNAQTAEWPRSHRTSRRRSHRCARRRSGRPGQHAGMSPESSRERRVGVAGCSDRLPNMGETSLAVSAADGRTLMVAQWGDLDGFPVFSLHGTPGSRLGRHYDESAYAEGGACVSTYDRPGYGGSDRHRGRRVVDCVSDVAAIADALGVERFAVTGGSGGGPHSRALAARLPARVTGAGCDVGVAPFETPDFDWFDGMDPLNVREFEWAAEGEEGLAREYKGAAAEMLERMAHDPSNVLGEDCQR